MTVRVHRLEPGRREDFFRLHAGPNGWGECYCVAWWLPTWKGWEQRTAADNRSLREQLFARGEDDGYLAYLDEEPVGWCQVGPRDRLEKLRRAYDLAPDPDAWAVTCFFIAEAARGRGIARALLAHAIEDLRARGIKRLEAFPKPGEALTPGEAWTGPASLFEAAGFASMAEAERPVYALAL